MESSAFLLGYPEREHGELHFSFAAEGFPYLILARAVSIS
jgi:hypothetical protein